MKYLNEWCEEENEGVYELNVEEFFDWSDGDRVLNTEWLRVVKDVAGYYSVGPESVDFIPQRILQPLADILIAEWLPPSLSHRLNVEQPELDAVKKNGGSTQLGAGFKGYDVDALIAEYPILKKSSKIPLNQCIVKAIEETVDKFSVEAIWTTLIRLADAKPPMPPLIGFSKGSGVKWRGSDGNLHMLDRASFRKRLHSNITDRLAPEELTRQFAAYSYWTWPQTN